MASEEHTQMCSNSSGGGGGGGGGGSDGCSRSLKKLKEKKIPQRGLGVAQLEKIRLEEQQKKGEAILSSKPLLSPSNSSCLGFPCAPNFRDDPSPNHFPLPTLSPIDLSSPNSNIRPSSLIPTIDVFHPNSLPSLKPSNGDGRERGWPMILGNFPKLRSGDYNLEGENHRLNLHSLSYGPNLDLPYNSTPVRPPQNEMQKTQQFQQQPPPLSMVNVSSGTSSSSVINCPQIEPPSYQSFYGKNNKKPMRLEEEKMVGRKRSYPYSVENPPGLSFSCKLPPTSVPLINRSDEPASGGNGGTSNVKSSHPIFRGGPLSSSIFSELNPKKVTKQNGNLNGDFLTLAPPTTALPHPSSKHKHPSVYLTPHGQELPDFESLPFQGSVEDPIHRPGSSGLTTQQQASYSFFPSAKAQIAQTTTTLSTCSGGGGETLDLNLKL